MFFSSLPHTNCGDPMADKQHLLRTLAVRTYTSRQQICVFLKLPMNINLRALLERHIREYHLLESQIHAEAASIGTYLYPPDPCYLFLSSHLQKLALSFHKSNAALSRSIIKQCTLGIEDGRSVWEQGNPYPRIRELAQQLMDCEAFCINQINISQ